MRELKCEECGEVVIILEKGSKMKPDLIVAHTICPDSRDDGEVTNEDYGSNFSNGAENFERQMKSKDTIKEMFGGIF